MFQKFKQTFTYSLHHQQEENDHFTDVHRDPSSTSNKELTPKEIQLVRQTWSILRNDLAGFKFFGAELLVRYFAKFPDYQKQFKSFQDVPIDFHNQSLESIRIDKKMIAHGTYVMYTLGMLVDNLENPLMMEQMLKRLARNHYRRHVSLLAFERLRDTLLLHLQERLGEKVFNKKTMIAWHKAFGYLLEQIERNFQTLNMDLQRTGSYYRLNSLQRHAKHDLMQNYQRNYLLDYQQMRMRRNEYLSKLRSSKTGENVNHQQYSDKPSASIQISTTIPQPNYDHQDQKNEKSKNFLMKALATLRKRFGG